MRVALALPIRAIGATDVRALVPVHAEPAQVLENPFLRPRDDARRVEVLDAHHERAVGGAGAQPGDDGRADVAEVELAGGAGGVAAPNRVRRGHGREYLVECLLAAPRAGFGEAWLSVGETAGRVKRQGRSEGRRQG